MPPLTIRRTRLGAGAVVIADCPSTCRRGDVRIGIGLKLPGMEADRCLLPLPREREQDAPHSRHPLWIAAIPPVRLR